MRMFVTHIVKLIESFAEGGLPLLGVSEIFGAGCHLARLALLYIAVFALDIINR